MVCTVFFFFLHMLFLTRTNSQVFGFAYAIEDVKEHILFNLKLCDLYCFDPFRFGIIVLQYCKRVTRFMLKTH